MTFTLEPELETSTALVETAPCAMACTWPVIGLSSSVWSKIPPESDCASPSDETVTSSVLPMPLKGSIVAVTITAATLREDSTAGSTVMPNWRSMLVMLCTV